MKSLFVSSKNRDQNLYPYGNSYTVHLTTPIRDISRVELLSCAVPNTLYNVTDGKNLIWVNDTANTVTDQLFQFAIPEGFYSGSGLATEVKNSIINESNVEVVYLSNEGKLLFRRPITDPPFGLAFKNQEAALTFGFSSNAQSNSQNTASLVITPPVVPLYYNNDIYNGYQFIKSDQVVRLNPNDGIFLDIEELRSSQVEDCKATVSGGGFYSGKNISRTFGLIPMDVNSGAIKNFKRENDYDLAVNFDTPLGSIDRLTVRWTDKDGNLLKFNGAADNSFILRFYTDKKIYL